MALIPPPNNGEPTTSSQPKRKASDIADTINMRRLVVLRTIAISFEILALFVAVQVLSMTLPIYSLAIVIAAHGGLNVVTWLAIKNRHQWFSAWGVFGQLVADTFILTALLYFVGGSTNPFVSLFLLPLIIVAAILPAAFAWAMAATCVACYTLLLFFYQPMPHVHIESIAKFDLHVLGMWFGFLLSVGLIAVFVVRMADSLRERDRVLTESREKALRDQHLVALGTLATGAAHELGTPLATMAVLASELKNDHAEDPNVAHTASVIREQLERCKSILSDMTASAGQARVEDGRSCAIDEYLDAVLATLRSTRPTAMVQFRLSGQKPAPRILVDKTLTQSLLNVLDNAADASIGDIEVEVRWTDETLVIYVRDRGEGLSEKALNAAWEPFFTTKPDGQGLGLYIARAVIDRLGGDIRLKNRSGGGTEVVIELPLVTIGVP